MTVADQVAAWVAARLTWLPDRPERLLLVPLLVLLTYWALRIVVQIVLSRVLETLAVQVIPAVVHLGAVLMLAVEFLAAQVFRLVRLRPAGAVYWFGDVVVRADGRLSALSRSGFATATRLRRFPRFLLAVAAGYLIYRWGLEFCDRAASSPCVSPTEGWWAEAGSVFDFLRR